MRQVSGSRTKSRPSSGDRTLVSLYAPLLCELPPSPDLFEYVATQGQEYYFGAMHYLRRCRR